MDDASTLAHTLRGMAAVMHFAAHSLVSESVVNPRKHFDNNLRDGAFEYAMQSYSAGYGLRFLSLRYFNAAGCHGSGEIGELHIPETHLIPSALQSATGSRAELQIFGVDYDTPDGTCVRDYIHVEDLAEAHVLALECLTRGGACGILNLGTGKGHTVKEVVTTIEQVIGRELKKRVAGHRPGDPPAYLRIPRERRSYWDGKPRSRWKIWSPAPGNSINCTFPVCLQRLPAVGPLWHKRNRVRTWSVIRAPRCLGGSDSEDLRRG